MASRFVLPFADVGNGIQPEDGSQLFFFVTGTSTPKDTFSNSAGTIPNTNPVIADSNGLFSDIFITGTYKVVLKDKNDVQIWEADPVSEFAKLSDNAFVKNFLTLKDGPASTSAVESISLEAGDLVKVVERANGEGGGAFWSVILKGATPGVDLPDTFTIVASTGNTLLALVLDTDQESIFISQAGGISDGVFNNSPVYDAIKSLTKKVRLETPTTSWLFNSDVTIAAFNELVGVNTFSTLVTLGDSASIQLAGSHSLLSDMRIKAKTKATHNDHCVHVGLPDGTRADRAMLQRLYIEDAGINGIQQYNGNLVSFEDIVSVFNTNDGIEMSDLFFDNNACIFTGVIDLRSNGRDGLHCAGGTGSGDSAASRSHSGFIQAQQNGRFGVFINSRSNVFTIYSEANGSDEVRLETLSTGNFIMMVEGGATDNSGDNTVLTHNSNADFISAFSSQIKVYGDKGIKFVNKDFVGTKETIQTADRNYETQYNGSSLKFTHKIKNLNTAFNVQWQIEGGVFTQNNNEATIGNGATGTLLDLTFMKNNSTGSVICNTTIDTALGSCNVVKNGAGTLFVMPTNETNLTFSVSGNNLRVTNGSGSTFTTRGSFLLHRV